MPRRFDVNIRPTWAECDDAVASADPACAQGFHLSRHFPDIWNTTQVAEKLLRLRRAGCDGVHLVFFDWENDLRFFCERMLPLIREGTKDRD